MTEKWAQQSHKAFPPCLAQRVHCADDPILFSEPASGWTSGTSSAARYRG